MDVFSPAFFSRTDVFGTDSDALFNDLDAYRKMTHPFVKSVKIWYGDVIDCIEFSYNDKNYEKGESPFFHGGKNGHFQEFKIDLGDFITKIEGEYGLYPFSSEPKQRNKNIIIRLRFTTRNGKTSSWYGNACGKGNALKGHPFCIDVGNESVICCLYGATWKGNLVLNNYIQAIGAYCMTYLDAVKLLEKR